LGSLHYRAIIQNTRMASGAGSYKTHLYHAFPADDIAEIGNSTFAGSAELNQAAVGWAQGAPVRVLEMPGRACAERVRDLPLDTQ